MLCFELDLHMHVASPMQLVRKYRHIDGNYRESLFSEWLH